MEEKSPARAPKAPKQPTAQAALANTNAWSTRQLVTMALLCAIGVLLSFVEFPLLPGVTWLKYDASAMPALVCGFAFGPAGGLAVSVVGAIIHGILMADFTGALMNILVVIGFVGPAAFVYARRRTFRAAVAGLALSVPLDAVVALIVPVLIPFNLAKAVINAVLTLVVYKSVSNLITPRKDQVKGR